MTKYRPRNERIKHEYFIYLKEARRRSEATVDAVAKALNRFEVYTKFRDFRMFRAEQAVGFKHHLAEQVGKRSGQKLSKSTLNSTLTHLKAFFLWLADKPGYKSRLQYAYADFFNLSEKDARIARATRGQRHPTLEQIKHVLGVMPISTDVQRRDRALIAFTAVTAARVLALASLKLKHVNLEAGFVDQDAREVQTKFSKTVFTPFIPVDDEILAIVTDYGVWLREEKLFGNDDPLFPKTCLEQDENRQWAATGLSREHWSTSGPIRKIFKEAFRSADLPYFHPHSFRHMLGQFAERNCRTPEEFKAVSQALGHENVLTTFCSYGTVSKERQLEIMRDLAASRKSPSLGADEIMRELRLLLAKNRSQ